jgi:DNA phosphorothioation-dependent restriction protein DptH
MNLFVWSVAEYIKKEWDRGISAGIGPTEVRFIVESLDPDSVFQLFQEFENHRLHHLQNRNIKGFFRVATNLWRDWCQSEGSEQALLRKMQAYKGGAEDDREWIDEEDRLTWYRSRTAQQEGVDALATVPS